MEIHWAKITWILNYINMHERHFMGDYWFLIPFTLSMKHQKNFFLLTNKEFTVNFTRSFKWMCCKWGGEGGWWGPQGKPPSRFLLMEHCFSAVKGRQAGFSDVFELSVHWLVSCKLGGGGTCRGNVHHGFSLWNIVSLLYKVFRPGSTKSSIYRSIIVQVLD